MEKLRQFEFLTLAIKISFLLDFCTDILLKFCFEGALYKYACFPNGLASAPRIFTKLLKLAYAILRSMGHLNSGYIDDSYLQGDTSAECHKNVTNTITLFTKLGFQIHPEKSVFIPSQKLTFLGFVLDSNAMTVMLTEEKVLGILSVCALLLKTQMPTIRQVTEVIGILVSNFPGAQYKPLHYSTSIQSDASTLGWGAVFGTQENGGEMDPFGSQIPHQHIGITGSLFCVRVFL